VTGIDLKVINKILNAWNFNGAVCLIIDGENIYTDTFGMADFEKGCPFTKWTTMEIASLSKQFTAVAIMTLVEDGLLDLDSDISKLQHMKNT
jgi:D-alanyl-D-alanine carboxypeptidase